MSDVPIPDPIVATIKPGVSVGGYTIEAQLGVGGMGAVFRARDLVTKFPVAIKVLFGIAAGTPDLIKRFQKEAAASNGIRKSKAFPRAIQFGMFETRPFIVMEYLEGESLEKAIRRAPIPIARTCDILMQIADAMQAAHDNGIVHRDLKPDNVYLVAQDDGSHRDDVKVLDLGIAKFLDETEAGVALENKTKSNVLLGTPQIMSPEQCKSSTNVDHRSDIYSLGVIGYRMLTSQWPFDGETFFDVIRDHILKEPEPLRALAPWVPEELAEIIHKALEKEPSKRWQHMREMREALAPVAAVTFPLPINAPTVRGDRKPITTHSASSGEVRPPTEALPPNQPPSLAIFGVLAFVFAASAGGATYYFAKRSTLNEPAKAPVATPSTTGATTTEPQRPSATVTPTEPVREHIGRVRIKTTPSGASVYVDGKLLGSSPVELVGSTNESKKIRVALNGFDERQDEVLLTEAGNILDIQLQKKPSTGIGKSPRQKRAGDKSVNPFQSE